MTAESGTREIVRPDGARVAFDVVGDGPPVVFLHGITNRRQGWDPVTGLLTRDFTCIRIDFRGHGESSLAPDYGMASLVGDVGAVAEELGVEAPAVVGSSLGANVAAIYAATSPASAVVCVGQSLLRWGDFAPLVQSRAEALLGEDAMRAVLEIDRDLDLGPYEDEGFEERVLAFPPEVVRGIWAALLSSPPIPPEDLTAIVESVLPGIEAPLLALHGAPPPADYPAWLTGLVPSAEVEVWEGMGHLLHLVDPPRFADRLRVACENAGDGG